MITPNPETKFDICEKRKQILEGNGHMLVIGGPGCGKTTIALLKARRRVLDSLQTEKSILFLSFSNSAIRRILESSGDILSHQIAEQVEIKTYHSFAWDILKSHGYLTSNKRTLKIVAAQDAAIRVAGLSKLAWGVEQDRLYLEDGLVTYDQFAPRAAEILIRSQTVRKCFASAYPLILVDEFQDTDEAQWSLIQELSKSSTVIALGDKEQRIYEWREGVSENRLSEFGKKLKAKTFDFQNENNRSPATGIAGYARSLLSPDVVLDLPDDISTDTFAPGMFAVGLRFSIYKAWKETSKRTKRTDLKIAIAARSKPMVRTISDTIAKPITIRGKVHRAIPHDVMFDQMQVVLAARVIATILGSQSQSRFERLAGSLNKISDMHRAANNATNIKKSDTLRKWAAKCVEGNPPKTKCVNSLNSILDSLDAVGFTGAPTEDWLAIRKALASSEASELVKTAENAKFLRLLRKGSLIEEQLSSLWQSNGNYSGAVQALDQAILQEQLLDTQKDTASISVLNMHQLKGREYDAVVLVEDRHRTFLGRENTPPYMDTRRLLQVALTRAKHYVVILSANQNATLEKIM